LEVRLSDKEDLMWEKLLLTHAHPLCIKGLGLVTFDYVHPCDWGADPIMPSILSPQFTLQITPALSCSAIPRVNSLS